MKIKKYNEKEFFKTWSENDIKEVLKLRTHVKNLEEDFEKHILHYMEINNIFNEPICILDWDYIYLHTSYKFYLAYQKGEDYDQLSKEYEYVFTHQQYHDFLEFLQDPDLYEKTKKYNL